MIRTALHWTLLRLAVLPWLVMMAGFWLALALVVWADRLKPYASPMNCWTWAGQEWWRRMRAWMAEGMPQGREPYILWRYGRSKPPEVTHALVGDLDRDSGVMGLDSYKPDDPHDVPVWLAWTRLRFKGRVVRGD
jgi:hypothetical protein